MDLSPLTAVVMTLIVLWIVGVISFVVWITKSVEPGIRKMLTSGDFEEAMRATKVLYPPRFNRD